MSYISEVPVEMERDGDVIWITPKVGGVIHPTGQDITIPAVTFAATSGEPIVCVEVRLVRWDDVRS